MFGCGKAMAVRSSCPCGPITSLMLLLLMAGCRAQALSVITAAVGGSVTLTPRFSGTFSSVVWKFYEDKVVEMDVNPPYLKFYELRDRAALNNTTLALTITGLTKAESGSYLAEVEVTIVNKQKIEATSIELHVLDPVSVPTITNRTTEDQINVTCEAGGDAVRYRWEKGGQELATGQEYTAPRPQEEVVLTCVASNEVSEKNRSVTIPNKPNVLVPAVTWSVIGLIIFSILLFFAIVYICYMKKKLTKHSKLERIGSGIDRHLSCKKGINITTLSVHTSQELHYVEVASDEPSNNHTGGETRKAPENAGKSESATNPGGITDTEPEKQNGGQDAADNQ